MCVSGKVCAMDAVKYVDEEEDLDDDDEEDLMGGGAGGGGDKVNWLRNVVRRNTQVAPEGKISCHYSFDLCSSSFFFFLFLVWFGLVFRTTSHILKESMFCFDV